MPSGATGAGRLRSALAQSTESAKHSRDGSVSSLVVAQQYEAFAYPEPFADLEEAIHGGYSRIGDPSRYAPVLWPRGKRRGS